MLSHDARFYILLAEFGAQFLLGEFNFNISCFWSRQIFYQHTKTIESISPPHTPLPASSLRLSPPHLVRYSVSCCRGSRWDSGPLPESRAGKQLGCSHMASMHLCRTLSWSWHRDENISNCPENSCGWPKHQTSEFWVISLERRTQCKHIHTHPIYLDCEKVSWVKQGFARHWPSALTSWKQLFLVGRIRHIC